MSSDGPGVRKVRGESSAGDSPELPPLSKSLLIRNKLIPDPDLCTMMEDSAMHKIVLDLCAVYVLIFQISFEVVRIGLS